MTITSNLKNALDAHLLKAYSLAKDSRIPVRDVGADLSRAVYPDFSYKLSDNKGSVNVTLGVKGDKTLVAEEVRNYHPAVYIGERDITQSINDYLAEKTSSTN